MSQKHEYAETLSVEPLLIRIQLKREHRFVYNSRGSKGSNCLYCRRYTDHFWRHSPEQLDGLQPLQDPDLWSDAYGHCRQCGTLVGR